MHFAAASLLLHFSWLVSIVSVHIYTHILIAAEESDEERSNPHFVHLAFRCIPHSQWEMAKLGVDATIGRDHKARCG